MLEGTADGDRRRRDAASSSPGRGVFVARGTPWRIDVGRGSEAPLRARRGAAARIGEPRGDRERRARHGDRRARVHAARAPGERLRVGDPVRRLHPGRARARPLPPLRRGRLRPRRARAPSTSTARARRCAPARASTCRPGSSTASRTTAPARCACSASSVRRARRPRPTTPTAPRPPCRQRADAAHRAHRARRLGREPRARRGHARRRDRRVRAAARSPSRRGSASPGGKTSPEELLAAAHGGCLTMSLAGELTAAGHAAGPARRGRARS